MKMALKLMTPNITLKDVLDMDYVLRNTERVPLKVELRKTEEKGVGLYATKSITEGETVALYQIKVFRIEDYDSPTMNSYMIGVYTPAGNESKVWVGDIVPESLQPPIQDEDEEHYIPYWAYFSNEPSPGQSENTYIDMNLEKTYKNRKRLKGGDLIIYKLVATENITPGEEIVWDYGSGYGERDY